MCVVGNAQSHKIIIGYYKTRTTLLRGASNATPVILPIPTIKKIVHDEQRSLALAMDVLKAAFKDKNMKQIVS